MSCFLSPVAGPSRDDHKVSPVGGGGGAIGHSPGGPVLSTGDHHSLDGPSLQGRGYQRILCEEEVDSVTGLHKSAQRKLFE